MSNVRIELNSEGVREILRSPEMLAICEELAEGIKDRYGDNAEVTSYTGINRVNASIVAPKDSALENNSLLKAVRDND